MITGSRSISWMAFWTADSLASWVIMTIGTDPLNLSSFLDHRGHTDLMGPENTGDGRKDTGAIQGGKPKIIMGDHLGKGFKGQPFFLKALAESSGESFG